MGLGLDSSNQKIRIISVDSSDKLKYSNRISEIYQYLITWLSIFNQLVSFFMINYHFGKPYELINSNCIVLWGLWDGSTDVIRINVSTCRVCRKNDSYKKIQVDLKSVLIIFKIIIDVLSIWFFYLMIYFMSPIYK